jgi:hypothetical protein
MKELLLGDFRRATQNLDDDVKMILAFAYHCELCGEGCFTPEDRFRKFIVLEKEGVVRLVTQVPDHTCLGGKQYDDIAECING